MRLTAASAIAANDSTVTTIAISLASIAAVTFTCAPTTLTFAAFAIASSSLTSAFPVTSTPLSATAFPVSSLAPSKAFIAARHASTRPSSSTALAAPLPYAASSATSASSSTSTAFSKFTSHTASISSAPMWAAAHVWLRLLQRWWGELHGQPEVHLPGQHRRRPAVLSWCREPLSIPVLRGQLRRATIHRLGRV